MRDILLIALGGAVGSMLRYGLARWQPLPYGTLLANVLACALIGYLTARLTTLGAEASHPWRMLVGVGFCGGLSTFSTLILELADYGERGAFGQGLGYLLLSLAMGIGALLLGRVLA